LSRLTGSIGPWRGDVPEEPQLERVTEGQEKEDEEKPERRELQTHVTSDK
jgi:hypothetical protein